MDLDVCRRVRRRRRQRPDHGGQRIEPECPRTRHDYGEEEVYFLEGPGRFYVGFACFPDA